MSKFKCQHCGLGDEKGTLIKIGGFPWVHKECGQHDEVFLDTLELASEGYEKVTLKRRVNNG